MMRWIISRMCTKPRRPSLPRPYTTQVVPPPSRFPPEPEQPKCLHMSQFRQRGRSGLQSCFLLNGRYCRVVHAIILKGRSRLSGRVVCSCSSLREGLIAILLYSSQALLFSSVATAMVEREAYHEGLRLGQTQRGAVKRTEGVIAAKLPTMSGYSLVPGSWSQRLHPSKPILGQLAYVRKPCLVRFLQSVVPEYIPK